MHIIAAKAVAFGEALQPTSSSTHKTVVDNAKALGETLHRRGHALVSGGTDTHLMLVDLRPKGLTGKAAEIALDRANITCNKNAHPVRSGEAGDHLRHPAGFAGGHHARLRHCGIPQIGTHDRRSARWAGGERR